MTWTNVCLIHNIAWFLGLALLRVSYIARSWVDSVYTAADSWFIVEAYHFYAAVALATILSPVILIQHLICAVMQKVKPLPIGIKWTFVCFKLCAYRKQRAADGSCIPKYFKIDWEAL